MSIPYGAAAPHLQLVAEPRPVTPEPRRRHELLRPTSALWWVYLTMCVLCGVAQTAEMGSAMMAITPHIPVFGAFFVVTSVIFIKVMLLCDPYRTRRVGVMTAAFGGGATISAYLALQANSAAGMPLVHLVGEPVALSWSASFLGPTTEEWTKFLVIVTVMLLAKDTLTRLSHGMMVGAFTGLGFQISENIAYCLNSAVATGRSDIIEPMMVNLLRFSGGFTGHNFMCIFTGVGTAFLLGRTHHCLTRSRRILIFAGLYTAAWTIHFVWNSPPPSGFGGPTFAGKIATGLALALLMFRWIWRDERLFLRQAATEVKDGNPDDAPTTLSPAEQAAIGDRRTRRAYLKQVKKDSGRRGVKQAKADARAYLDRLQAWGRRGTGIDDFSSCGIRPTGAHR